MLLLLLREIIPERNIQSIEYRHTEHVNPFAEKADVRIDVECVAGDGTRFIVEVQRASQRHFGSRMLYYSAFAVQQQLAKGHTDFNFPPVYIIALMNFDFHGMIRNYGLETSLETVVKNIITPTDGIENEYMFRYMLREDKTHSDILTDRLNIILIELTRIKKECSKDWTRLQKFLYYLSHMTRIEDIPEKDSDEMFMMLHNSAKTDTFTPEEQEKYIKDMTTEQDIKNQIEFGRFEGHKNGLVEGERKKALEIARKMLEAGIPFEQVVSITGLSEDDVSNLSPHAENN